LSGLHLEVAIQAMPRVKNYYSTAQYTINTALPVAGVSSEFNHEAQLGIFG
jgi:hypothetical protein